MTIPPFCMPGPRRPQPPPRLPEPLQWPIPLLLEKFAEYRNQLVQDVIAQLPDIALDAYVKPEGGIPESDMTAEVAAALALARTSVQDVSDKADLVNGKVPSDQLPSYVDDILEYASLENFPATGEEGKLYVAKDTNKTFRWSGTQYTEVSPSPTPVAPSTSASAAGKPADAKATGDALALRPTKAQLDAGWWSEWTVTAVPSGFPDPIETVYVVWYTAAEALEKELPFGEGWYLETDISTSWGGNDYDASSIATINGFAATRRRVAAPVPTKPEDIGAASVADATLTPMYSQTPTFSEWEFTSNLPVDAEIEPSTSSSPNPVYYPDPDHWQLNVLYNGDVQVGYCSGTEDDDRLEIKFEEESGLLAYTVTATRTRTDIIGYTLGSQTTKPLQPQGDYALLAQLYAAVRNLAPDFTAKTYALNDLCTYNGVFYRCKLAYTSTSSGAKPDADTTHWEAKKVSELFLPLAGGTITGNLYLGDENDFIGSDTLGAAMYVYNVGGAYFSDIVKTANGHSAAYAKPSDIGIPAFSTAKTYVLGAKVVYDNALWNCTTAVSTAGAWNAANWTKLFDLSTDATPTANSKALMTSGDIKTALDAKALASKCKYEFHTATVTLSTTTDTNDTADVAVLDHAKNSAIVPATVTTAFIRIPDASDGYTRDLFLSLTVEGSTPPSVYVNEESGPADIIFGSAQFADIDTGRNLILFSEVEEGKWKVAVEHEDFPGVTP